jgi:hypothetical protein
MNMDNVKSVHGCAGIGAYDLQAQRLAVPQLNCHCAKLTLICRPENYCRRIVLGAKLMRNEPVWGFISCLLIRDKSVSSTSQSDRTSNLRLISILVQLARCKVDIPLLEEGRRGLSPFGVHFLPCSLFDRCDRVANPEAGEIGVMDQAAISGCRMRIGSCSSGFGRDPQSLKPSSLSTEDYPRKEIRYDG